MEKLELLTDFYEFTMSNGYFENNKNDIAYFDVFFRKVPDKGGYAITAGLEQIIEFVQNLKFDEEDINYLKSQNIFSQEYLEYLKNFKFTGDMWAIPEGTVVFPNEPLITIKAPLIEAQLLETAILNLLNHESLIATKTSRIVRTAGNRPVMEFGARRAHRSFCCNLRSKGFYYWGCCSVLLVHLRLSFLMFLQVELWLIVGYKALIVNMKRLSRMRSFIQMVVQY